MHVISRGTVKFQTIIGVFVGAGIVPYANLTISRAKVSHVWLGLEFIAVDSMVPR